MEKNNHHLLVDLYGKPGFEFVELFSSVDGQQKRKYLHKIKFDASPKGWLQDPPPKKEYHFGELKEPDTFGLWADSWKRPTTDRFFVPKEPEDEDSSPNYLTAPPSICVEPKLKALLESKPLVRNHDGKKCLFLPDPMFEADSVFFTDASLCCLSA